MPDEEVWKKGLVPGKFTEMRPAFGRPEMEAIRSSFYLLYDDDAIYFSGLNPDTYQDKINALSFFVMPLNEQFDIKYGTGSEDGIWNAVYETRAKIYDNGAGCFFEYWLEKCGATQQSACRSIKIQKSKK